MKGGEKGGEKRREKRGEKRRENEKGMEEERKREREKERKKEIEKERERKEGTEEGRKEGVRDEGRGTGINGSMDSILHHFTALTRLCIGASNAPRGVWTETTLSHPKTPYHRPGSFWAASLALAVPWGW